VYAPRFPDRGVETTRRLSASKGDPLLSFVSTFIPLFFAIDVVGLLPVFLGLTEGMTPEGRKRVVNTACITGIAVATSFIFLGEGVFRMLSVTPFDFRIAGGLLLLIFAVQDLIIGGKPRKNSSPTIGVVPLGMPLIVGPGVLTTCLLLVHQYGYTVTLLSLGANLVFVYLALRFSGAILRIVTPAGAVAVAKIASLLLAAIGVMMVRVGVEETVRRFLDRS
jgi:multiple antibiotic resistance protein